MQNDNDVKVAWLWIIDACASLFLWAVLIVLKAVGAIDMHWAIILSGIGWIFWGIVALTLMLLESLSLLHRLKLWLRRRKNDRRVIRQAKAIGIWDGNPIILGGRALELKAWKLYKIRRAPGETDKELRQRCMTAADNEYAAAKHKTKIKDGYAANITLIDEEESANE